MYAFCIHGDPGKHSSNCQSGWATTIKTTAKDSLLAVWGVSYGRVLGRAQERGRLSWRARSNGLLATSFIEQRGKDFRWMSWTFRRK